MKTPGFGFGELIGTYKNRNAPEIRFYTQGVCRDGGDETVKFAYDEISDVALADGLVSLSLRIRSKSGETQSMPVTGNDGNRYDSLAVLHFLTRVIEDIENFPTTE